MLGMTDGDDVNKCGLSFTGYVPDSDSLIQQNIDWAVHVPRKSAFKTMLFILFLTILYNLEFFIKTNHYKVI
jgi:hypothetical protein